MKPSRIIPLLWLVVTIALALAAAQNWYEIREPIPGIQRTVATGIESFPLLASTPWLALLCLALIWYLGTVGKVVVALLTAALSFAGAAQILLNQTSPGILISKIEKRTGITQTVAYMSQHTKDLGLKNYAVVLLIALTLISVVAILNIKTFPTRNPKRPIENSKSGKSESLWEE